jgi:hypothetical protein
MGGLTGNFSGMIPDLPNLAGAGSGWLLLSLKALGAMGFMTAANVVILYAC